MNTIIDEIRTEVKTYQVSKPCTDCEGTMEYCSGMEIMSNPAQYPHKCTNCGKEAHIAGCKYPYVEYVGEDK